ERPSRKPARPARAEPAAPARAGPERRFYYSHPRMNGTEEMASTTISTKDISELRRRTGAGMMDCKNALEEANGDMEKAAELLRKKGIAKGEKRAGRTASQGVVVSYIHHNQQVGAIVELNCETDFVARTDEFSALAREIALHVASADPIGVAAEDVPAELIERERRIAEEQ